MDEIEKMIAGIVEVAEAHNSGGDCAGLPFCVACRAVALLMLVYRASSGADPSKHFRPASSGADEIRRLRPGPLDNRRQSLYQQLPALARGPAESPRACNLRGRLSGRLK